MGSWRGAALAVDHPPARARSYSSAPRPTGGEQGGPGAHAGVRRADRPDRCEVRARVPAEHGGDVRPGAHRSGHEREPARADAGLESGDCRADLRGRLERPPKITAPTLLIWGAKETFATRREQDELVRGITGARLVRRRRSRPRRALGGAGPSGRRHWEIRRPNGRARLTSSTSPLLAHPHFPTSPLLRFSTSLLLRSLLHFSTSSTCSTSSTFKVTVLSHFCRSSVPTGTHGPKCRLGRVEDSMEQKKVTRREALGVLGAAGAVFSLGCGKTRRRPVPLPRQRPALPVRGASRAPPAPSHRRRRLDPIRRSRT